MNGRFISFEGTEGSGKTSVIKEVKKHLENQGFEVIITREPGGIKISEKIRDIILDVEHIEMDSRTEALLFAASRRQHLIEKVIPALSEGKIVLCDRFVDSSLVYQGIARNLGLEEVYAINKFAIESTLPDLTIFVDVRPEVGLKRVFSTPNREINRLDLEKLKFHKKIYQGYLGLIDKYPKRIKKINGEQPMLDVAKEAIDNTINYVERIIMSVYSWDEVSKYQNDVARIITNSYRLNRIAHAYIFEGPNGTKKTSTAFLYAKSLLCTNSDDFNPCNECHNCRRIDNRTHPNVFYVKPKGKVIKKEQIKNLINEFSKASIERGPRIYIIEEADKLNITSSNTLLKTMEEPGQDIYQILITENYNSLIKTIISRAETLHFKPIDRNLIRSHLITQGIQPNIANSISEYTVDMGSAIQFAEDFEMINIIKLVTEIYKGILVKEISPVILFKNSSQDIFKSLDLTDFFLTLMIFYQKDVLHYQLRHHNSICFEEEIDTIKKLSERISQKHIEENIINMLGLKARLKYNINNKLAFDKMLACLERGY